MSNTKKLSSDDLKQQTAEAQQRLDTLRQEQVEALEEGREFEHNSEILLVSERIDALTKAVSRAETREEEARAQRIRDLERKRLEQVRSKATVLVEKRVEALQEAEAAMYQTIGAMQRFLKVNDDLAAMMQHGKPIFARYGVPDSEYSEFGVGNVHNRLSLYLSSAFGSLGLNHNNLGQLTWHSNPGVVGSWNENETNAIMGLFNGLFLRNIDKVLSDFLPIDSHAA